MIELKHISKSFSGKQILFDINAKFEAGKVNLIIGQSGHGKSVLTKCIVGLHTPEEGQVLFDGRDFVQMDGSNRKEIRKEIGMLFQGSALFDSMTVEENIMFPLQMFTDMSKEEMQDRANFVLERVNMTGSNHLFPSECSGGMQKRVAIARAISLKPKYLFCDEPNSGLDPKTSIVIDNLIKEITYEYNMTTIVVTHDMNSVIEIGDNIIFIYNGQKWWEGTKQDILTTENQEILDFVYASQFMKQLKGKLST
ncbi:MAG: ATP-binding cassette domain-containing protein [Crocinitomicaceae bacterium]|nr:ATP-binding cassette domain-containing protein [Crocinitomicaceae bacterium]